MTSTTDLEVGDRYGAALAEHFHAEGWWSDRHLSSHLDEAAARDPDAPCVSDGTRSVTYGELRDQSYALARSLLGMGVHRRDRVVVQLPNWVEFAVAYVAVTRIGAVMVPMMPVYRADEAGYVVDHSGAVLAVTCGVFRGFDHAGMFRRLVDVCPSLERVVVARGAAGDAAPGFDELVASGAGDGDRGLGPAPHPDDVHLVVYTSGTESRPKGCCHTWNTFGFSARGLAADIFRLTAGDTVFMPSPVAHSTGLVVGIAMPLVVGAATHLLDVWDPLVALERIGAHRCTVTASATPFLTMAAAALDPSVHDVGSLRAWLCAGAPIPPAVLAETATSFPDCRVLPLYGCSEVLAGTACTLDDPPAAVVGSDGRAALAGVEIRLTTAAGGPAGTDEEGEISYRGPGCMLGYWRDPARTAAVVGPDGWYRSGDLGRWFDGDHVRVTGRIKDLVIRGGTNISAREVEEHLDAHPKVRASAVVGYPDARLGERACAFVVPSDLGPPTLPEIADHLRAERHIAMFKIPERLEIVTELPVGATGKVQKFELRARITSAG